MPNPISRKPLPRGPFTPQPKPPAPPKHQGGSQPQDPMDRMVDGFWKAMQPVTSSQNNMLKWFQHRDEVTRPGYVPPEPREPGIHSAVPFSQKAASYLAAARKLLPERKGAQALDQVTDGHLAKVLQGPKLDLKLAGTTAVALELATTRPGENHWASEGERLLFAHAAQAYPGLAKLPPEDAWNLLLGVGVAQETSLGAAGSADLGALLDALGQGARQPTVKTLAAKLLQETKAAYAGQYDNGIHHRRAGLVRLSQTLSRLTGGAPAAPGKPPAHHKTSPLLKKVLTFKPAPHGKGTNTHPRQVFWPVRAGGTAPSPAVHTVITDAVALAEGALEAVGLKMPPVSVVEGLNNAEAIDGGIRVGTTLAATLSPSQLAQVLGHEAFHLFAEDPETSALSTALKDAGVISPQTAVAIEHATELTADLGAAVVGYMIGDTQGYLGFLSDHASPATASHPATADRMAVYTSAIEGLEKAERDLAGPTAVSSDDAPISAGDPADAAADFGGLNDFGVRYQDLDDSGREVGDGSDGGDAGSLDGGGDGGFDAGGDGGDGGEG